jgi:plasmid maintenance system antidote protein VapI
MEITSYLGRVGKRDAEVCRLVGISSGTLSGLKSGRRPLTLKMAKRIQTAVGVNGLVESVVERLTADA